MKKKNWIPFVLIVMLFSCENSHQTALMYDAAETGNNLFQLNVIEYEMGNYFISDVQEEINTTPRNAENRVKLENMSRLMERMDAVGELTGKLIRKIETLKMSLLKDEDENMVFYKPNNENRIIQVKYDFQSPELPAHLNLDAVKSKAANVDNPGRTSFLWKTLNLYRKDLVELLGTYAFHGKSWSIRPQAINTFNSQKDLKAKVQKMIRSQHVNLIQDEKFLTELYCLLTLEEKAGAPWTESNLEDLPLLTVINNLSLLENKVLTARKMALKHIKGDLARLSMSMVFDDPRVLVHGPSAARRNEEITFKILVAAFETGAERIESDRGVVSYESGVPVVKVKVSGQKEMRIKGKLIHKTRSGVGWEYPWEKVIKVED